MMVILQKKFHRLADAYCADAVLRSAVNGVASDMDASCTRARIMTFLWRLHAGK